MDSYPLPRKRRLAVAAAVSTLTAVSLALAGCSGGGGGSKSDSLQILVVKHGLTQPMKDMKWTETLEEAAGVPIVWQEVSADWDQKKSPMLASGDVPDLVVGVNAITNSDLSTYGTMFADLSQEMDSLPNVKDFFAAQPKSELMATQPDGKILAIPSYKRYWPDTVSNQYVNQEWLDNVGMDVPETWDDLLEVLKAFRDQDANGNGDPNDEIPFSWSTVGTGGFGYSQPAALLGSLGLPITSGGGAGYYVEDGKVGNFLTDERYKQVIEFVHELYAENLVSKEAMTQDYSAFQSTNRGNGDTAAVGFGWGWTASDLYGAQLADQYTPVPALRAPGYDGPLNWSFDGNGENYPANAIVMSASTKHKEAALNVINAFYDQDMSIQVLFGDIGPNITKTGDNAYEILPPADGKSDPSTWKWTTSLADSGPMWIRDDIEVTLPTDLQEARDDSEALSEALGNADPLKDILPTQFMKMSQEDLNTLSLNDTAMLNIAMTNFGQWVTNGGIDDAWGNYVDELERSGIGANIEIYQKYYDEYVAAQ